MKLTELYKSFNDKPLHEQEEKRIDKTTTSNNFDVKIEIPGIEGETDVNIKLGHATGPFEDVTISWGDESYNVSFDEEEMIEDHGNEGQDWVFLAKHRESETEFRVDVAVEADYDRSGNIQEVDWDTLQVEFDQETESLDEGTCGYGIDGKSGDKPAGPHLNEQGNGHWRCPERDGQCFPGTSCPEGITCYWTQEECEAQTWCVASTSQSSGITKHPLKSKRLEESVISRLQKLANIK